MDSLVYVGYHNDLWKDQWDWDRIRKLKKTPYEKALLDLRIATYNIGNKYTLQKDQDRAIRRAQRKLLPYEIREIDKICKELERKELFEPFDTKKKEDKWSVIYERRGNRRTYIYKEKRIGGKLVKEYMGKSWPDILNKIKIRAKEKVLGEKWGGFGLSQRELEIQRILMQTVAEHPLKMGIKYRNPLLQKYIEQLGMTFISVNDGLYSSILTKGMSIEKRKRILDNARKAIAKHDRNVKTKEERIMSVFTEEREEEVQKEMQESTKFKDYEEYYEDKHPKVIYIRNRKYFVHYY